MTSVKQRYVTEEYTKQLEG